MRQCVQGDAWRGVAGGEGRSSSSHHHANSRCDKVAACKHQSNLNLAYHLPEAVCSQRHLVFPDASDLGPRATRCRTRVLSSRRYEMIDRLGVMRAALVPSQVATEANQPNLQCVRFAGAEDPRQIALKHLPVYSSVTARKRCIPDLWTLGSVEVLGKIRRLDGPRYRLYCYDIPLFYNSSCNYRPSQHIVEGMPLMKIKAKHFYNFKLYTAQVITVWRTTMYQQIQAVLAVEVLHECSSAYMSLIS